MQKSQKAISRHLNLRQPDGPLRRKRAIVYFALDDPEPSLDIVSGCEFVTLSLCVDDETSSEETGGRLLDRKMKMLG